MKNAARISDNHQCPSTAGEMPHVGGPALGPGAPSVLVGGLPAVRIGDLALCIGPVDAIKRGAPTVLIEGKNAARRGDSTVHGGVIMTGHPTVLIGGEMPTSGPAETLEVAMNQIRASDFAQTPEGADVLATLEDLNSDGKITLGPWPGDNEPEGWDGYEDENGIVVNQSHDANPDATASELVHEGSHSAYGEDPSIDQETQANQDQQDFYQEQRQAGYWNEEQERRAAVPNLGNDVKERYPTLE